MCDREHTSVWSVEHARSGRSHCKATKDCGQACQELDDGERLNGKGELRIGRTFEICSRHGDPFMTTKWMNLICVSAQDWGKIGAPEDLEGFDDLSESDQVLARYAYANPSGVVDRARDAGHIIPLPASLKKERCAAKKRAAEEAVEDEGGHAAPVAVAAAPKTLAKAAAPRPKKKGAVNWEGMGPAHYAQ